MRSLRRPGLTGSSSPTCSPRWATARTLSRRTLADPAAYRIAEKLGTPLMPWQGREVLDVALEVDPKTRKFAYRDVVLTVPRQSGKTTLLLVLILLIALHRPRQGIRYTAQTAKDARNKWMDDWLPVLEQSEFASQFRARKQNGHEGLLFTNGSQQGLLATTEKSGHGGSIDLGILDESFAHPDSRLEQALSPSMITRRSPQLWVVSTAGTPDKSPYLWSKVEAGRRMVEQGINTGTAYFEWSAPDDCDPSDESIWWSCMPALGLTTPVEAVRAEYQKYAAEGNLSEFRRAYLNQWVASMSDPVIPLDVWNRLVDPRSAALDPVAFAFDVSPDRSRAAICAAGRRPDGLVHVEVVDHRAGTDWVVERVAELARTHKPSGVFCATDGPAWSLKPDMDAARVEVTAVGAREHAQACGMLYDAATQDGLRHLGTPELLAALDGAVKRTLTDAWAWSRRSSNVDISPLVGVTLALWGVLAKKPAKTVRFISLAPS